MIKLGRALQLVGLLLPPVVMAAQLTNHLSAGRMLQFLALSVGVFTLGYVLQQYRV